MRKKVTIHSDGTPSGTIVLDEDGKKLDNVTQATIWLDVTDMTRVDLTIVMTPVIIQGQIDHVETICPKCEEHIEHTCKGSGGSIAQASASSPIPTQHSILGVLGATGALSLTGVQRQSQDPCGEKMDQHVCDILKRMTHDLHVDLTTGAIWSNQARTINAGILHHL